MHYPEPISKLIDSFMKLPGIGPKTAQRLAFHTLDMKEDDVVQFAKALVDVIHVLLTRPPLTSEEQAPRLFARLACIRHAASVHPEPGSNSP